MKIGDFLKENQLSLGDNLLFLLKSLGIQEQNLLKNLEREAGEIAKMSKSKANTVDPEEAINRYGADTVRLYVLFTAPPEQDFEWTEEGIQGAYRFLNRLWNFVLNNLETLSSTTYSMDELREAQGKAKDIRRETHQTLQGYLKDIEGRFQFNTAIAKIMKLLNELQNFSPKDELDRKVLKEAVDIMLLLLSPITPHLCEELWSMIGNRGLVITTALPQVDEKALEVSSIEIPVQVNGKLRAKVLVPYDGDEETAKSIALSDERVKSYTEGKSIRKVIYVKNKLINIVVG